MNFYSRLQTTVKRLISNYGETAVLRVMDSGTLPDSNKPWMPAEVDGVDHTVKIVFIPDGMDGHQEIKYLKNTELVSGQINGYMAVVPGLIPKAKDVVVRGTQLLTIDNISPLNPGGIDLLYKFEMGA